MQYFLLADDALEMVVSVPNGAAGAQQSRRGYDFCGGGSFSSGWFAQSNHGQEVAKAPPYEWTI